KMKAIQNIRERLRFLERTHKQFLEDIAKDAETVGLKAADIAKLNINAVELDKLAASIPEEQSALKALFSTKAQKKTQLLNKQAKLNAKLNEPQLHYQQYLKAKEVWEAKRKELIGSSDSPDTLEGLK